MIKAANKHGVSLAVANPTKALREALPIWYHRGVQPGVYVANSTAGKCLRENHGVTTVLHCTGMAERYLASTHQGKQTCKCAECNAARLRGCGNPHRCLMAVERMVGKLYPKWRTAEDSVRDGLSLTRERIGNNVQAREEHGRVLFDPSITQGTPLAWALRVFASGTRLNEIGRRPPRRFQTGRNGVEVHTDGSCDNATTMEARAGSGIWFGRDDLRNEAQRVPYDSQTNQVAEIYAVIMAHHSVPPFVALHIVTD
ncbi:hypothetical protein FKP32DRAFT_1626268, partial [Trametes sanguinea]